MKQKQHQAMRDDEDAKIRRDHMRERITRLFEAISRRFNNVAKPGDGSAASGTLKFKSCLQEVNAVAVDV